MISSSFEETTEGRQIALLVKKYWGKGDEGRKLVYQQGTITLPNFLEEDGSQFSATLDKPTMSYGILYPGAGFEDFFGRGHSKILVREEYPLMLKHLESLREAGSSGVVVTGQPGIGMRSTCILPITSNRFITGKTTFLHYLLIERVIDGKPTAFQVSANGTFFLLGQHDLRYVPVGTAMDPAGFPGVWALVDSNAGLIEPRSEFTSIRSKFFLVQTSSPQPRRWKAWRTQLSGDIAVMKGWSWPEMCIGG
jgi:hypothetical protein